ncbi:MAG: PCRF domain-containing protein [Gammaproteobacteria bacterium]
MKTSIQNKLESLSERLEEINALLSDPGVIADQNQFRGLSQEYAHLNPVVATFRDYQKTVAGMEEARLMLEEDDTDMRELAQEELKSSKARAEQLEQELQKLMLPRDHNDEKNIFLEIRAGTGGDEAAIFAGDPAFAPHFGLDDFAAAFRNPPTDLIEDVIISRLFQISLGDDH